MSAEPAVFEAPGIPVEIGEIDRALGRLWEESDDTKTRASLINLAIYTESSEAIAENTRIIATIAGEHACRAILIYANPRAQTSAAAAWISAHCHLAGKGERQICSEQITFQLEGKSALALPNLVFSHLDSDLPLCFWWQGGFPEKIDEKLWSWVDRLIYDSAEWKNPAAQFEAAMAIGRLGSGGPARGPRTILCDLNWARLLSTRFAMATFFDHTAALKQISKIRAAHITHAPGFRTTAILLLGWLASQLGWKPQPLLGRWSFAADDGREISVTINERPGASIGHCVLECPDATFEFTRAENEEYFHASMAGGAVPDHSQMLSAGRDRITDILLMELSRGGRHALYLKALKTIQPLLQQS